MKLSRLLPFSLLFVLLFSCKENCKPYFSTIKYVSEFPVNLEKCELDSIALDCSGIYTIDITDSCLVLGCKDDNGFIKCFSIDDFSLIGSFLKRGRGPGEIVSSNPYFNLLSETICFDTGYSIYVCDFKQSILSGEPAIIGTVEQFYNVIPLCDSVVLVTDIYDECGMEGIRRKTVTIPSSIEDIHSTEEISGFEQPRLSGMESICPSSPIFTRSVSYSSSRHKVAEAAGGMNIINIYPIDTAEGGFSICYGSSISPGISQWESITTPESTRFFTNVRAYDDFLIVSYSGEPFMAPYTEEHRHPKTDLLFFDWNGSPLLKLSIERNVNSFGYNPASRMLYVLDSEADCVCRCQIPHLK